MMANSAEWPVRAGLAGLALCLAACGDKSDAIDEPVAQPPAIENEPAPEPVLPPPGETLPTAPVSAPEELHMYKLDCGTIEVSDLDEFDTSGGFAGESDTFTDTCWLIRHPEGTLLWDLGLPGLLAGNGEQTQGIYTVSLDRTISSQLRELGIDFDEIDYFSLSHSHFDHVGQVDQLEGRDVTWIVHEAELEAMRPQPDDPDPMFGLFADFQHLTFTGEYDVFGDGRVRIIEAPGHTPGHSVLFIDLPESGPLILIGDLYHRIESVDPKRIPRFNWDVVEAEALGIEPGSITRASMVKIDALAAETGARQIIQHEPESVDPLPDLPIPVQ